MGRKPCCDKVGLKRGPWTLEEDHRLMNFILNNGIHCWRIVPKLAGLLRCGKSCRLRWINYLRPDLKRGGFTDEEEDRIMELHSQLGNRWSKIASHFPGRTDNEIKNHWNTKIKKKMKHLGLDPVTHKPMDIISTEQTGSNQEIEGNTSCNIQEEREAREEEIKDETPKDEITIETTNILTKSDIDEEEEELMTKNYETLCTEISYNSSLNNSVSIDDFSNNIINISRSESSSYFVEDSSISLEQWDMDFMDPLIPWDLYTSLDDSLFLL